MADFALPSAVSAVSDVFESVPVAVTKAVASAKVVCDMCRRHEP